MYEFITATQRWKDNFYYIYVSWKDDTGENTWTEFWDAINSQTSGQKYRDMILTAVPIYYGAFFFFFFFFFFFVIFWTLFETRIGVMCYDLM